MALVDLDKFVASMMEHYYHAHNIDRSVTRCWIDSVLEDQGLEYEDGKIVKSQRRVSAEAKENGYGELEDERIRKRLLTNFSALGKEEWGGLEVKDILAWLEKQGQKPAWTEADDEELENTINALKGARKHGSFDWLSTVKWLLTIKQRIRE